MGFYTRFTDPAAHDEIVRYYQFLHRHDALFRGNRPRHEVLLTFPRRAVHNGDLQPLARFREFGTQLLNEHVLFDIRPDDTVTPEVAASYRQVISSAESTALPNRPAELSRFEGPTTVRVSLSQPAASMSVSPNERTLHLVNYNREEPKEKRSAGSGLVDEKPIAVEQVTADLHWPDSTPVKTVELLTPEQPDPVALKFELTNGRLKFAVPRFLVYAVVRIQTTK